jgi:glycosyltransferase involved in cell wall biosynthesis
MENKGIIVGIDASRNRGGGAKAHLIGILKHADPPAQGIHEVHVWTYKALMDAVPDYPWLVKHSPPVLEKSLLHQVWWQYSSLPQEAKEYGCNVLLNTDAGSVCPFRPGVTMSRDMLSYEPVEMRRSGLSRAWLRLFLLRFIQTRSLKKASGAIFLTNYAASVIQKNIGIHERFAVIPHGVGEEFRQSSSGKKWPISPQKGIRCLYVSNTSMYKHQWNVVKAIGLLRQMGHNITLLLVGGGDGRAQKLLDEERRRSDPLGEIVEQLPYVRHDEIAEFLRNADVFVFASSCENMPNTLVEAMASSLPIACSNRGPMPEVLRDGGQYFDPENPESIAAAIAEIITDSSLRHKSMRRASELADLYSWKRCSAETFRFLYECATTETKKDTGNSRGLYFET